MQVTGILSGSRIIPEHTHIVDLEPEPLLVQFQEFIEELNT
jgi:hypothetical protein